MSKSAHSNQATMDEIEAKKIVRSRNIDLEATEFALHLLVPTKMLAPQLDRMKPFGINGLGISAHRAIHGVGEGLTVLFDRALDAKTGRTARLTRRMGRNPRID